MIRALDLFCGIGGWTTGAHRTGSVSVRVALNHSADAIAAHERAHPQTSHLQRDALEFPFGALAEHVGGGWLLASPVCRDFSEAGQPAKRGTGGNGTVDLARLARTRRDARSTSHAVISAAEALAPETILVENVPGFYRWALYPHWRGMLEALGYVVREHTINAADYGAAVDRPRAIITASKRGPIDLAPEWNGGRASGLRMIDCLDPFDFSGNRWADVESKPATTRNLIRRKQAESGLRAGILNNVGDGVRMRPFDDLAPSFTTQTGTQLMHVDGDRVRIVNPRELGRMAGFTDTELDALPRSRGTCSTLLGNVIAPAMSEPIIRQALAVAA